MAKPPVSFQVVPLSEVPSKPPLRNTPSGTIGSQWDEALKALRDHPDKALKIGEANEAKRARMRSTITIMAHNRGMNIEVRDAKSCFYVFLVEREGRYHAPV